MTAPSSFFMMHDTRTQPHFRSLINTFSRMFCRFDPFQRDPGDKQGRRITTAKPART